MSNKNPPGWVDSIYQIKTTDRVQGGPNGVINTAPAQLAQRTEALKGGLDFATTLSGENIQFVGTFDVGFTLKNSSQALSYSDGKFYVWHGEFDKVVPPNSTPETTGGFGDNAWIDTSYLTFRRQAAQPDGTKLFGYMEVDVYQALSRLFALNDFNKKNGHLGYNPTDDALVISQAGASDRDLMMNGGFYFGKKLRGIRRRGTVLSIRANQTGAAFFNPAVTGVYNSMGLRGYSSVGADGVTTYMDINSLPFSDWENVESATYTDKTFTPDNPDTWVNIEVGDYIYTKHDAVCCGIVTGKNQDGSITVDMWADSGTTTTTPKNGIGFYVNPENKLWVNNNNLFLPANGRATRGVIQENGVRNDKVTDSNEINGIDTVVLGGAYDCTAAYLSRGSNGRGWKVAYMAQGAKNASFQSTNGVYTPLVDFYAGSTAQSGLRFRTANTISSISWVDSSDINDNSEQNTIARIGPKGYIEKMPLKLVVARSDTSISSFQPCLIISASGITVTLPALSKVKTGHEIKLLIYAIGTLLLTAADGASVEGRPTYTINTDAKCIKHVIYDGSSWLVF